ncbi:MAG: esterase family protein [Prevotella sp.]|nr:esterase family protein [Prevotella sp.]
MTKMITTNLMSALMPLIMGACSCNSGSQQPSQTTRSHDTTTTMSQATQQEPQEDKSQVLYLNMHSKILNSNIPYTVYLPPSFSKDKMTKYPILYLLHGMADDNKCWIQRGKLQTTADELIKSGKMREMVIVTPLAGSLKLQTEWNGYFNMPGWSYEDFFMKEFMPKMEADYRVIGDRGHRAVAGLSMGGGAATSFSQRYPDLFCACYAMSALMDDAKLPGYKGPNSKVGMLKTSVAKNSCTKFVTNADAATKGKLMKIKWYVDCGDKDFLLYRNKEFMAAMDKAGIPYQKKIRPGTHNWQFWSSALFTCLPFISNSMAK